MASRNTRKILKQWVTDNAVKIKCCYCDEKDVCKFRTRKEKWEEQGVMTRCTMTPNKKKKKSKKKINKKPNTQKHLPKTQE